MTENEAIKHLQSYAEVVDNMIKYCKDFEPKADITGYLEKKTVFAMAISAIKEVQQYREIGTVEECREAVEKQKPKKIIIESYCSTECPTCGHELSTSLGDGYYKYPTFLERCPNCGQVIQWEENLEGMEE